MRGVSSAQKIPLTRTEAAVLGLLAWSNGGSGYDLQALARNSLAYVWAPTRSQLYAVLPRLEDRSLVFGTPIAQAGRPDKVHYAMSVEGRATLSAWIATDEEPAPEDRDGMLLKVFIADFGPAGVVAHQVAAYRRRVSERLAAYEALEARLIESDERPGPLAALRLGIALMRATATWAAQAERELSAAPLPVHATDEPGR